VDAFQIVMISIYIGLSCIEVSLVYLNGKQQYLMAHLLPSSPYMSVRGSMDKEGLIKKITNHYYGVTVIPIRKAIVVDCLGPDLGPIVLSFLPTDEEYDYGSDSISLASNIV